MDVEQDPEPIDHPVAARFAKYALDPSELTEKIAHNGDEERNIAVVQEKLVHRHLEERRDFKAVGVHWEWQVNFLQRLGAVKNLM